MINHRDNYEDTNEKIIERIQNKINSINRNYKAKLYGSRATNLCLMWSDIDIVICNEKRNNINNIKLKEEIKKDSDTVFEEEEIKQHKLSDDGVPAGRCMEAWMPAG